MSNPTPWSPQSDQGSYFSAVPASTVPVDPFGVETRTREASSTAYSAVKRPGKSRIPWIVAAALLVVAVVAGGIWFTRTPHHTLSLGTAPAGYRLIAGGRYDSTEQAQVAKQLGDNLKGTTVGEYGAGTDSEVLVGAGHPTGSVDNTFQNLADALTPNSTAPLAPVSAGKLGGLMECTTLSAGTLSMPVCVWHDQDTIGVVSMANVPAGQASKLAVEFRGVIEH